MPTRKKKAEVQTSDVSVVADEVISGKWGKGDFVQTRLHAAGHDPDAVLDEVERKLSGGDKPPAEEPRPKSVDEIAGEVLAGKWGSGDERKNRLEEAGYDYDDVQLVVNRRIGRGAPQAHKSTLREIAQQVAAGHYGEMPEQKRLLEAQGWHYASVQAEVNQLRS